MLTIDTVSKAIHIFGVLMWIGGLFAAMSFLEAVHAEPEAAPRSRLIRLLRQAAIVPDVGLTIGLVFGLHWLFKFELYEVPYMHLKLALVAALIGIHVIVRVKAGKAIRGAPFTPPPVALKPVVSLIALGVLIAVVAKWPPGPN